ncbi:hypothetical protein [Leifsonia aquatica]|uniref:hypothetical protein n=1 Tax=Leifsonia aquatica TaxID=144185 RepID=UPI000468FAE2|nr:hypothetical protein [Leifsonia aquatica]
MIQAINIEAADLDGADDRRYQDILTKVALHDGRVWTLMLEPERIDRTNEQLRALKSSLERQLGYAKRFQKGGVPEWRKKVTNLLAHVETYLADISGEMKRLDREELQESAVGELEEWKGIAEKLAELLVDDPMLETIRLPRGRMTVAEWVELRAERRAA